MAKSNDAHRRFIVLALACWDTPTEVSELLREQFGIDVPRTHVAPYDPTKVAGEKLAELKNQIACLGRISGTLEGALAALHYAEPKIIERFTRVEVQSPLPAGCRIDAGRLQHINEASRLANSAGQSGEAMSAGAGGDER